MRPAQYGCATGRGRAATAPQGLLFSRASVGRRVGSQEGRDGADVSQLDQVALRTLEEGQRHADSCIRETQGETGEGPVPGGAGGSPGGGGGRRGAPDRGGYGGKQTCSV